MGEKNRLCLFAVLAAAVAAIGLGFGLFIVNSDSRAKSPLPEFITKDINYLLYYPAELPAGYSLDTSSVRKDTGVIFYSLSSDIHTIHISQQALPDMPPTVANTNNNTVVQQFEAEAGQVSIGTFNGLATGFIIGKTTLISMTSTAGITPDQLATVARTLKGIK